MLCHPLAVVMIAIALASAPAVRSALADEITGRWCPENGGRSLSIQSEDDVSFNGNAVAATVSRHRIEFDMPAGEPDAGQRFRGNQLSDEQIRVTIGKGPDAIWRPCKPVS